MRRFGSLEAATSKVVRMGKIKAILLVVTVVLTFSSRFAFSQWNDCHGNGLCEEHQSINDSRQRMRESEQRYQDMQDRVDREFQEQHQRDYPTKRYIPKNGHSCPSGTRDVGGGYCKEY